MNDTLTESSYISPSWDNPNFWNDLYAKNEKDQLTIDRNPQYLLRTIEKLNRPYPLKILDAGTGISTMAEFTAYLGHQVVAVDISAKAIEICNTRKVTEGDLIRCVGQQYSRRYNGGNITYLAPETHLPVDLESELKKLFQPGGIVTTRKVINWNDPELPKKYGTFDIILNQNGLRCASFELIRQSCASFYALLKPGGVLIETNINALIREKTITKFAVETGFSVLDEIWVLYDAMRQKTDMNDREKYIVCCWPTG